MTTHLTDLPEYPEISVLLSQPSQDPQALAEHMAEIICYSDYWGDSGPPANTHITAELPSEIHRHLAGSLKARQITLA